MVWQRTVRLRLSLGKLSEWVHVQLGHCVRLSQRRVAREVRDVKRAHIGLGAGRRDFGALIARGRHSLARADRFKARRTIVFRNRPTGRVAAPDAKSRRVARGEKNQGPTRLQLSASTLFAAERHPSKEANSAWGSPSLVWQQAKTASAKVYRLRRDVVGFGVDGNMLRCA